MIKKIVSLALIVFFIGSQNLTAVVAANSQSGQIGIIQPGANSGVKVNDKTAPELLTTVIGNAIGLIFTFSAIVFVLIFFWGAVDWIFAAGDKEKVAAARRKITQAIVGFVILSLSWVIFALVSRITGINLAGDMTLPSFMNP